MFRLYPRDGIARAGDPPRLGVAEPAARHQHLGQRVDRVPPCPNQLPDLVGEVHQAETVATSAQSPRFLPPRGLVDKKSDAWYPRSESARGELPTFAVSWPGS